jgi:hypothetical protein
MKSFPLVRSLQSAEAAQGEGSIEETETNWLSNSPTFKIAH